MSRIRFSAFQICSVLGVLAVFSLTSVGVQLALDPGFRPILTQHWSEVSGFAVASDGKIYASVVSGRFGMSESADLVKLNQDGSIDESFILKSDKGTLQPWVVREDGSILVTGAHFGWVNPDGTLGIRFPTWISCINGYSDITHVELLAGGKILIGGSFCYVGDGATNWSDVGGLIRLNPNGTLDPSFRSPSTDAFGSTVFALLPDERLLVSATFAGDLRPTLVRLKPDGRIDPSFKSEVARRVTAILPDDDGKSWVAGAFSIGTSGPYHLVRLNSDGSLDSSLNSLDPDGVVQQLVREKNGSFIVSGVFSRIGGIGRPNHARILQDGSVDPGFAWPASLGAFQIAPVPTGKLLILHPIDSDQTGLARLNSDGSLDPSFKVSFLQRGTVLQLTKQRDGQFLTISYFRRGFGVPWVPLTRFHEDGLLDTNFNSQLDIPQGDLERPTTVVEDQSGRLLVGLSFATNNYWSSTLVRLNHDGTRDTGFKPPLYVLVGDVSTIARQADRKIVVGTGGFFPPNSEPVRGTVLARFNDDGSVDKSFDSPLTNRSSVAQVAILPNGQFLIAGGLELLDGAGSFGLLRLNANGTADPTFDLHAQISLGAPRIDRFFIESDGRIVFGIGGDWTPCFGFLPALVRLNPDGTLAERLLPKQVEQVGVPLALDSDDRVIIWNSGNLARLQPNWSVDPVFGGGPFFVGGYVKAVNHLISASDGSYVLSGDFIIGPEHSHQNVIRLLPTNQRVPPFLSNPQVSGQGAVNISAFTAAGWNYQIQATADLDPCTPSTRWTVLTNVFGTGDSVTVSDSGSTNAGRRFYRIAVP
ncbi:MAG: hypothetical protein U1G07_05710 [Verrucomicrobiota bacterium]